MEDIEIARNTKLKKITEIAEKLNIQEEQLEQYGKFKAKISPEVYKELKNKPGKGNKTFKIKLDKDFKTSQDVFKDAFKSGFLTVDSFKTDIKKSKSGKNVLVIGSELHSTGLDMTTRGRGVFGNFWRWSRSGGTFKRRRFD